MVKRNSCGKALQIARVARDMLGGAWGTIVWGAVERAWQAHGICLTPLRSAAVYVCNRQRCV